MKWCWALMILISPVSRADEVGRFQFPERALEFKNWESAAELREKLELAKDIAWVPDEVVPEVEQDQTPGPVYLAKAVPVAKPYVVPLSSGFRDCAEVRREAREVKRTVRKIARLRAEADVLLRRWERTCLRRSRCDSRDLESRIGELSRLAKEVEVYLLRETWAEPDRVLHYRFVGAGVLAPKLLKRGYTLAGESLVQRMRHFQSDWIETPSGALPEGFTGFKHLGRAEWIVQRRLRASEACLRNLDFGFDLATHWRNGETGESRNVEFQLRATGSFARP